MDSTQTPIPSASKLPIKRKTPDSNSNPIPAAPDSNSSFLNVDPITFPPITTTSKTTDSDPTVTTAVHGGDPSPPPFKFHRIWTESDEIRFLQGLLDCGSKNLSFPRDLNVFYARFSNTMSQPYTKSQLSEKLRRLRKKYRVISTRLSKGLDQSFLSPHDRALYEICRQLWHPDYAERSPFGGTSNNKPQKSDLVGVEVNFLPTLPVGSDPNLVENVHCDSPVDGFGDVVTGVEGRLSEVNVVLDGESAEEGKMLGQIAVDNGMEEVAVKAVMDAFDESLKEVRMGFVNGELNVGGCMEKEKTMWSFGRRWQEQIFAEMEALGHRMRLVSEYSLMKKAMSK